MALLAYICVSVIQGALRTRRTGTSRLVESGHVHLQFKCQKNIMNQESLLNHSFVTRITIERWTRAADSDVMVVPNIGTTVGRNGYEFRVSRGGNMIEFEDRIKELFSMLNLNIANEAESWCGWFLKSVDGLMWPIWSVIQNEHEMEMVFVGSPVWFGWTGVRFHVLSLILFKWMQVANTRTDMGGRPSSHLGPN